MKLGTVYHRRHLILPKTSACGLSEWRKVKHGRKTLFYALLFHPWGAKDEPCKNCERSND